MRGRASRASAVALTLLLGAGRASAAEPSAEDRARLPALLRAGSAANKAKKWDECIAAYAEAVRLGKTPETLGNLGLCEEAQGQHDVDAYHHLREALISPGVDRMLDESKRTQYEKAFAHVGARVAEVYVSATPPHAVLLIDGRPIGKSDGRTFILEPGKHKFGAQLEGYADKVESRDLLGGDKSVVDLPLERLPQAAPVAATPAPVAATPAPVAPTHKIEGKQARGIPWCIPSATPSGVLMTLACAGLATTVVSGATAIGLEVHFQSLRNKLIAQGYQANACGKPGSPQGCAEMRDRGEQSMGAVYATVTAGIATGMLAGATALAFAFDRDPSRPSVALTIGPQGGGIGLTGAW